MLTNLLASNTQYALAGARLVRQLDTPRPLEGLAEYLEPVMGVANASQVYITSNYPVTFGYAVNDNYLRIFLSGVRTVAAGQRLAQGWLNGPATEDVQGINPAISNTAASMMQLLPSFNMAARSVAIFGHSYGGAIAIELGRLFQRIGRPNFITVVTYGQPRVLQINYELPTAWDICRWVTPNDNVPRLPPGSRSAPLLYNALNPQQQRRMENWVHPCQATEVSDTGAIRTIDDAPSDPIGVTTILAALNSNTQGVFGTGHLLSTYIPNLERAIAVAGAAPVIVPAATNTRAPTATITPPRFTPPVVVAPLTQQELDARVAYVRDAQVERDQTPVAIGPQYRMKAVRDKKVYYVEWCGWQVCWAPTKKKARALARHFNRFLAIYQGVGVSNSDLFVRALTYYLALAADPNGPLKPTLNNGGQPSVVPITDLSVFGIDLAPFLVP